MTHSRDSYTSTCTVPGAGSETGGISLAKGPGRRREPGVREGLTRVDESPKPRVDKTSYSSEKTNKKLLYTDNRARETEVTNVQVKLGTL